MLVGDHHRALAAGLGDQLRPSRSGVLGFRVLRTACWIPSRFSWPRRSSPRPRPKRSRQHRLTLLVAADDFVDHRPATCRLLVLKDLVVLIEPEPSAGWSGSRPPASRRFHELGRLGEGGYRSSRRACRRAPEVVLQGDRGERLVSLTDRHALLSPRPPGAGPPTSAAPRGLRPVNSSMIITSARRSPRSRTSFL